MPKAPPVKKKRRQWKPRRGRPKKLSSLELAERRQTVLTLRLKGMSYKDIAKEVNVGYMTVKRDLEQIRQENLEKISKFNRDVAIGQAIATYNEIEREAWKQYHGCRQGTTQQANFLNMVRAANNDKLKLLVEIGLITRAAARVEHKLEADGVLKGWTQDAKQLVAMAIIQAQMQGEGGNGKPVLELPAHMVEEAAAEGGGNGA